MLATGVLATGVLASGCGAPSASAPASSAAVSSAAPSAAPFVFGPGSSQAVPSFLASDAKLVPALGMQAATAKARGARTLGTPAPLGSYNRVTLPSDGSFAIVADYRRIARIDPEKGDVRWKKNVEDISTIALSPDGQAFALAADDTVTWMSAKDGSTIREIAKGDDLRAEAMAVSPDGKRLAFTDYAAARLRVVEVASGREVASLGGLNDADALRFSPDGSRLCATRSGTLRVWDLASGHAVLVEREPELAGCAFVDDTTVVTGGARGAVVAREIKPSGARVELVLPGEWGVSEVEAIAGTKQVVVRHLGPYLSLVDVAERKEVARFEGDHKGIAVSGDGALLVAYGGWGGAVAFDVRALAPVVERAGHVGAVSAVAAGGGHVVTGGTDGAVVVWDAATGAPNARLFGYVSNVTSVAIGAGGHVAFGGGDGHAYLMEPNLKTVRAHVEIGDDDVSVAFSPDGKVLVAASADSESRSQSGAVLVDVATGAARARFDEVRWSSFAFDAARGLMVAGPDPIRVVHLATGTELRGARTWIGESGRLWVGIADGRYLISAQTGDRDYVWALGASKKSVEWLGSPVAFSPSGTMLAGETGGQIVVSDTASGSEIAKLPSPSRPISSWDDSDEKHDRADVIAFAADGATIVSGHRSGVARVLAAPSAAPGDTLFGVKKRDLVGAADLATIAKAIDGGGAAIVTEPARHVRVADRGHLTVSPDGERAVVGGRYTAKLSILRTSDGGSLREIEDRRAISLSFVPGGRVFALTQLTYGERVTASLFGTDPAKDEEESLAADCRWAVPAGKKELVCLGYRSALLRAGAPVGKELPYGSSDVAAMSPAGGLVAQADEGIRIIAFDASGLRVERTLRGLLGSPEVLAFAPSGKVLASADDGAVVLHDPKTGAILLVLEGQRRVAALAFSSDGKLLATAGDDRTVRVWDAITGDLKVIVRSRWEVRDGVGFAKDGKTLLTLGDEHLVFWKLP